MKWGRSQVSKSRSRTKYPKDWKNITSSVEERDGGKCFFCNKTREQLRKLSKIDGIERRLETHHLMSIRTGNNKKTNLVKICSSCHAKQHNHKHLRKQE